MYINIYILYIHMTIENISQRILSLGPCAIQGIWSRHLCSRRAYDWHCKTCAQRSFSCALSAGALRHTAERWVYIHVYIYIYIRYTYIYSYAYIFVRLSVLWHTAERWVYIYIWFTYMHIYLCVSVFPRTECTRSAARVCVYICIYEVHMRVCVCVPAQFVHAFCGTLLKDVYTFLYIWYICISMYSRALNAGAPQRVYVHMYTGYIHICLYVCVCVVPWACRNMRFFQRSF